MKKVLIYQCKSMFSDKWFKPECYVPEDEEDYKRCMDITSNCDGQRLLDIIEVEDDVEEIDLSKYYEKNGKYADWS